MIILNRQDDKLVNYHNFVIQNYNSNIIIPVKLHALVIKSKYGCLLEKSCMRCHLEKVNLNSIIPVNNHDLLKIIHNTNEFSARP